MGTIINPIGDLSGKVGDFVFRKRNGKTIISMRPHSYTKSNSERSVNNRSKFKLSVMVSSSINKNPVLKEIWQNTNSAKQRAAFNIIVQHVNAYILKNDIDKNFSIFPELGDLNAMPKDLFFGKDSIVVAVNPVSKKYDIPKSADKAKYIQMVGIIKCDDPIDPRKQESIILSFGSDTFDFELGKENTVTLKLEGERRELLLEYSSKRIFFGFVILDENKKILCYSSTFDESIGTIPYEKSF